MGRIEAICTSENKGERKTAVLKATFRKGHGIVDDAHAGDWHRQVSLLAADDISSVRERLPDIVPGSFAENLVISSLDLSCLGVGSQIRLGKDVTVTITQIGKECHTPCRIYHLTGDCIMPRLGLFAKVDTSGVVEVGDSVDVMETVTRAAAIE